MPSRFVTVVETTLFQRQAATVWNDDERESFIAFIALHPDDGAVIPDTGGSEKCDGRAPAAANAVVLV